MKVLITALWLSALFLPFAGLRASLILFVAVLGIGMLIKPLKKAFSLLRGRVKPPAIPPQLLQTAVFSALLVLPFVGSSYVVDVAVLTGIYIILALGLNIVVGYAGLLHLGFAAFYAIGAYSYALINTKLGLGFWGAMPLSLGCATVSGFILGIPALRLRGDYFAIVTLGFGEITRLVLNNWDTLTNGPNGISGIEAPGFMGLSLGGLVPYYYFVLGLALLSAFLIKRLYGSRIGRAWAAIREDEVAASAMGINTTAYKLYAIASGAFFGGLAGVLFAAKMRFVSPESFTFMESVFIVCMVIVGGMGSIHGVALGALLLVAGPEMLREFQNYRMLALGAGLVLVMIFRPQGLFGGRGVSLRS